MTNEEGDKYIVRGDQRCFDNVLRTPLPSDQRIKLREKIVGITFAQPTNEEEGDS
jgi:hypothetical protein